MAKEALRDPIQAYQAVRAQAALTAQANLTAQEGVAMARAEARDDVHAAIGAFTEALRKKDAEAVVDCYGPEARMFTLAPPLSNDAGRTDGIEDLEAWFATWHDDLGYELAELQVTANEDVAFAHGLAHMTGTKTDSERVDLWFRETLCFRRIADKWKITHEHSSVPFYMDGSDRAATDLNPGSPSANANANYLQREEPGTGDRQVAPDATASSSSPTDVAASGSSPT